MDVRARRGSVGLVTILAVVGACDGGGSAAVVVRDSAGVEIVESHAPAWGEGGRRWRLEGAPSLDIGVVDGPAELQFDDVADVLRRDDGRIVVADGGSGEIRFFGFDGAFLEKRGGQGGGPGEFSFINAMGRAGDSTWVYDIRHRRFTVFPDDGGAPRIATLRADLAMLLAVGRAPDGDWVLAESWGARSLAPPPAGVRGAEAGGAPAPEAPREGFRRDPVAYVRFAPDGTLRDTLAMVPGRELELRIEGGSGGEGRMVMMAVPFGRTHSFAMAGDRLFIGDQVAMEIGEYEVDGTLGRLIRVPTVDLTLTEADVEAALDRILEARPERYRAGVRALWESQEMPETKPAYGRLVVDAHGNLWVGAHVIDPSYDPTSWTVFDRDGRWLGTVEVPDRFRVHRIDGAGVLGVWRDALDVEQVRLYPLVRRGG